MQIRATINESKRGRNKQLALAAICVATASFPLYAGDAVEYAGADGAKYVALEYIESNAPVADKYLARMYGGVIRDGGEIGRDFVPVKRMPDGTPGMFDHKNRTFYANQENSPDVMPGPLFDTGSPPPAKQPDLLRPDVLRMPDGTRISTAHEWRLKARPQILDFFEKNVYGKVPPRPAKVEFVLAEKGDDALDGLAKRRQYRIVSTDACGTHSFDVLVYLPKDANRPVPAFVCPNFCGNQSITDDPKVILPTCPLYGGIKPDDPGKGRKLLIEHIPVKDIVQAGFAIATFCHCDVYPDYSRTRGRNQLDGAAESVWRIFAPEKRDRQLALTAWAWGNMRVMDLFESMPEIDARKVAVTGLSRLGWASVITAAYDERFAMCCPNAGGCKPLVCVPNLCWPAWFAPELTNWTAIGKYNLSSSEAAKLRTDKPAPPFEQMSLIGCIAPRALHIGTSTRDVSAPPNMSFGTVKAVEPVYRLFGGTTFPGEDRMLVAEPFLGDISWHCKEGTHSLTREDWSAYITDAKRVLRTP